MNKNIIKYEGELNLNDLIIPCYVLQDGTRVISARAMQNALKMNYGAEKSEEKSGVELSRFISSKWFNSLITNQQGLEHFKPMICYKGNQKINGYEGTTLVDFCNVMLEARKNGNLTTERQEVVAKECEILIRAFAKVGIIALIDEATGYQYDREKDELQKILKAYISEELLAWKKRFPDEFYREIFRLNDWGFTVSQINARPGIIGTWTKKYIYSVLPKGVLQALLDKTERNNTGKLKTHLHRHLTREQGIEHLNKQIISTVTLMNISDNWKQFEKVWNKKFGQQELPFSEFELIEPPKQQSKLEKATFGQLLGAVSKVPKPEKDK
jgi:hypothetical protein